MSLNDISEVSTHHMSNDIEEDNLYKDYEIVNC